MTCRPPGNDRASRPSIGWGVRVALSLLAFFATPECLSAKEPETPAEASGVTGTSRSQRVEAAIQKAKAYLYGRQHDGNWEEVDRRDGSAEDWSPKGAQWGGTTALSTYALLAAGESPQGEKLAKAVAFLKRADLAGTYAIACRAQVWALLPHPLAADAKAALNKDGDYFLKTLRGGDERGFYHYRADDEGSDASCSQYGVLGMWACDQAGYAAPPKYWQEVEAAWTRSQQADGGWSYEPRGEEDKDKRVTPSMTAAGVATLFITQDYLHANDGADCKGNLRSPNLEAGLKWMGDHFAAVSPGGDYYDYTLYGVERIGVASGHKYFGDVDWYARGANGLLKTQADDGSFGDGVADTCFAVLFLVRGRAPVVMNKLDYEIEPAARPGGPGEPGRPGGKPAPPTPGNWDQRPRDAANVTRWLAAQTERDLNWQIVSLRAPVDDLHDAPILYLGGNQLLRFNGEQQAKLRQFVEEGGLILGNADCGSAAFATSFKKLGGQLFPRYEFRELPANHPIYTGQWPRSKWKHVPSLLGLSNGARELMLLLPTTDPARAWQTRLYAGHEEAFQLLGNIFLYAVDKKDLRYKGDTYVVRPDPAVKAGRTIKVARLEYAGNWDPEPGGWRRLAAVLHNRHGIDLTTEPVKLGDGKLAASGCAVAHLTGTTAFKLPEAQRAELKAFVAAGGTLLVDAAGGSSPFADSAEAELDAMFAPPGGRACRLLPPDHAVFSAAGHGAGTAGGGGGTVKAEPVGYRPFARLALGALKGARLQEVEVAGRPAVFYSREDLSVGLVGQPVDGIYGYDPRTATALTSDVLLFALDPNAAARREKR